MTSNLDKALGKWQNRKNPGALDRQSQLPLVLGAGSCNPPRDNFPPIRHELLEVLLVFVVHIERSLLTEYANLSL